MGDVHHSSVWSYLNVLLEDGTATGLTDAQLLERFVERRDEAAFTAIVERHGPMVYRVSQEVVRDHHEAQDAFQATFLVLARYAGSIRQRNSLASWLHGVALRVAASARSTAGRRRVHEQNCAAQRAVEKGRIHESSVQRDEHGVLLHAEIGRLPERFRAAVVLCYLEGRTYEEAAQVLHCPVGTIKSRLATARERSRRRLEHLNAASFAGSVGLVLQGNPPMTPVPTPSSQPMLHAVVRHALGGMPTAAISQLTQGVLKSMHWHQVMSRLCAAGAILIGTAALVIGTIGLARMNDDLPAPRQPRTAVLAANSDQPTSPSRGDLASARTTPIPDGPPITVTGRIIDELGRPISGAEVRFRLFRSSIPILRIASTLVGVWEDKTDSDGRYRIANVRGIEGHEYQHFAMDVNASGFVEFIEFYHSELGQVAKSNGIVSDVRLERGDTVTGRCVGPDGIIKLGAKIHAAFAGRPMSSLGRARATAADGRFRLVIPRGLAAELVIYPEGRDPPPAAGPIPRKSDTNQLIPRRVTVAAGGGDLGDVRLEVASEIDTLGPVMRASEVQPQDRSLYVRVPGGSVPIGQMFAFESSDRGEFGWFPITLACKIDRDGLLRVPALKGSYKIWATQAHDSGSDDRGPDIGTGPPIPVMPQEWEFRLRPRSAPGFAVWQPVAIRGKVTDPDGKPAAGVALMLLAAIGSAQDNRLTTLQWTTTNADGHYVLTGIPWGLTRAHLNIYAEPPDRRSYFEAIALGNFQGTAVISSVSFEGLKRDQDPLDFRLKLIVLEPPAVPKKVEPTDDKELAKKNE